MQTSFNFVTIIIMNNRKISPEYPRVSLPKVIDKLCKTAVLTRFNRVQEEFSEEELAKILGYKNISGASVAFISSMKKYGMLEGVASNFKLDSALKDLIVDGVEVNNFEALKGFAFNSDPFLKIYNTFEASFPEIDKFISLLLSKEFTVNAIPKLIKNYQQTLLFLNEMSDSKKFKVPSKLNKHEIEFYIEKNINEDINSSSSLDLEKTTGDEKIFRFEIPGDFEATVKIKGNVNKQTLESLIQFLNVSKNAINNE